MIGFVGSVPVWLPVMLEERRTGRGEGEEEEEEEEEGTWSQ